MINVDLFPLLERINKKWAGRYEARRRSSAQRFLKTVNPSALEAAGRRRALRAFRRAATQTVFYPHLLVEKGIDPSTIRSLHDFDRLPIIDKSVFTHYDILDLVSGHTLTDARSILTSSGYSGVITFGVNVQKDFDDAARSIDFALDMILDITHRKTLLISCLPMGVKVYSNTMLLGEVSVREDMGLALVKKFGSYYDQIIITGEVFYTKSLIEEGVVQGIDWKSLPVSCTSGEDSFPENYRDYIAGLLGIDPNAWPMPQVVISSMGISELALMLFHEMPDTIRLRRLAERDLAFRTALFGDTETLPMLFHYYPDNTYLEESPEGQLIVTMTSPAMKIPLIRYNTHDYGRIIPYETLTRILTEQGQLDLLPSLHLPLVAVEGRSSKVLGGLPDIVRHAIFADHALAGLVTGYFKLVECEGVTRVRLHIKSEVAWTDHHTEMLEEIIGQSGHTMRVEPVPYYEFSDGLVLDYNKKFNHV